MEVSLLRRRAFVTGVLAAAAAFAQQPGQPVPVTVDNFIRAETDMYFGNAIEDTGSIGKFFNRREVMAVDRQTVIRRTVTLCIRRQSSTWTRGR